MAASFFNFQNYSRFNLSDSISDIQIFVKEYRERIKAQLHHEELGLRNEFRSFAERRLTITTIDWLDENEERFLKDTPNTGLIKQDYLYECGFICCLIFTPDGENIICGHSTGLIQGWFSKGGMPISSHTTRSHNLVGLAKMSTEADILREFKKTIYKYYTNIPPTPWYPMFYDGNLAKDEDKNFWVKENHEKFLKGTPNEMVYYRWFFSEMGAVTALAYSPNGTHIVVGHSSGMIEMRHGSTGTVLSTLRNIQFPPKPIYALEYSKTEERVCYAACMDGTVYRVEIPQITISVTDPPAYCIRADPALECLNMQFYGASSGIPSHSTPFLTQRMAALSLGLTADGTKMAVGYDDSSIKLFDMETQELIFNWKVHKLRLQFIPKKLQRMHFGKVCALRAHPQKPNIFASAAWDRTLRIWDTRCKVGCVMTFEGLNVCSDSIDINREECVAGSWQTTEGLTTWDLVAKKRLNIIRVQNRRPDVDGEYIYACRYWNSTDYNRKGKYAIIGGSGTNCVEVINLHNRYITCSYPTPGTVLAVASYQERIAFAGTATVFHIVKFYDPKHEKDKYEIPVEEPYDYANAEPVFQKSDDDLLSSAYDHSSRYENCKYEASSVNK